MKLLLAALVALFVLAVAHPASAFTYSPFGLQVDIGAGVKWEHHHQGPLEFHQQPWIAGGLTKQMGTSRWSLSGTLERATVQEADYEVRAGVWYRLGP